MFNVPAELVKHMRSYAEQHVTEKPTWSHAWNPIDDETLVVTFYCPATDIFILSIARRDEPNREAEVDRLLAAFGWPDVVHPSDNLWKFDYSEPESGTSGWHIERYRWTRADEQQPKMYVHIYKR